MAIKVSINYQQPWIDRECGVRLFTHAQGHLDSRRNVIVIDSVWRTNDPIQPGMIIGPTMNMPVDATIGAIARDWPALQAAGFNPTDREG